MSTSRPAGASVAVAAVLAVLLAVVVVAPASAARLRASIYVSPESVIAGRHVRVYGSARGGCRAGNTMTLISRAFPRRRTVAGLPAVSALVHHSAGFSVSILIPRGIRSGSYAISGRCRGRDLGVKATLKVHALAPTTAPTGPSVTGGTYSFGDEFNGSAVDQTQWDVLNGHPDLTNNEIGCYLPANTAATGGYAVETAKPQSVTCLADPVNGIGATGYSYTSGAIQAKTYSFLYGTITARIKFAGSGAWPAFWLLGTGCQFPTYLRGGGYTCNWPQPGAQEIDIAEKYGNWTGSVNQGVIQAAGTENRHTTVSDPTANYHVYTLVWTPTQLTWQVDGATTFTVCAYGCTQSGSPPNTPMFPVINTSVGGNSGGTVPSPQTTSVDYVHVTASGPTNTVGPAITGTAQQGHVLTCGTGTWAGSGIAYTYQWQQDRATDISGATSSTYVPVAGDVGQTLNCIVTAKDASGAAAQPSASTATVS